MNAHQISRIDLSPDVVDAIVFWTKNPAPMTERLGELSGDREDGAEEFFRALRESADAV